MEYALLKVGLPVKCRKCRVKGFVKPHDYQGWYKSRLLRMKPNKWFCPEHFEVGKAMDDRFYKEYDTPAPEPIEIVEGTTEALYALID